MTASKTITKTKTRGRIYNCDKKQDNDKDKDGWLRMDEPEMGW